MKTFTEPWRNIGGREGEGAKCRLPTYDHHLLFLETFNISALNSMQYVACFIDCQCFHGRKIITFATQLFSFHTQAF